MPFMPIDVAAHILPAGYYERLQRLPTFYMAQRVKGIPCLYDLGIRFRIMDRFPGYRQILSLAIPPLDRLGSPEATADFARLANDELAAIVDAHPDRFAGAWAGLPLNHPDASLRELERISRAPAFTGIQVYSNVAGRPLDEPATLQVIEEAIRCGLPILLHPARGATDHPDYAGEDRARYDLWSIFGWPYETTIAMARLVFTGLFDRHPDAVIIAHHLGAMAPYFAGRIDNGYTAFGTRGEDPPPGQPAATLVHPPQWYFPRFYADTALSAAAQAIRFGIGFFPNDHVFFGSDTPFDREGGSWFIRETIAALDACGLDPARRRMIDEENIRRVLARRESAARA
jgi:aminocarboxymuconate-semialdehyde decarboxylase